MFTFILMTILACVGFTGAILASEVRKGNVNSLWLFVCTVVSAVIWNLQVRSKMNLVLASALFTVVYELFYYIGFVYCGQIATYKQHIGMILMIVGMLLMN